ncbi:MAG TPA: hypothetical protein VL961_01330, partial [Acidimicrobiales bacterium]|nr:hypothetical protein [Acidimicrobiales bacterium]
MEDRRSGLVHLELTDAPPGACAGRAEALATSAGVSRVTWWENCAPGRTDLPMRVRDGAALVMVEVADADGFDVPPPAAGTTEAHTFRRHSRPSQGVLTGRPTLGLLVVWITPRAPVLASSLRDWGD